MYTHNHVQYNVDCRPGRTHDTVLSRVPLNTVEKSLLALPKVVRQQFTGEVGRFISSQVYYFPVSSFFRIFVYQKLLELGDFFTQLSTFRKGIF